MEKAAGEDRGVGEGDWCRGKHTRWRTVWGRWGWGEDGGGDAKIEQEVFHILLLVCSDGHAPMYINGFANMLIVTTD